MLHNLTGQARRRLGRLGEKLERMRENFITKKMFEDEIFLYDLAKSLQEENFQLTMRLVKRQRTEANAPNGSEAECQKAS